MEKDQSLDKQEIVKGEQSKVLSAEGIAPLILDIINSVHEEDLCNKFATGLWCIWRQQNDKFWRNQVQPTQITIQQAFQHLEEWKDARQQQSQSHVMQILDNQCEWKKPSFGYLKCNVDATIFNQDQQFGNGMCIRDHNGQFIQAKTWFQGVSDPTIAEACGLYQAMEWLKESYNNNIISELDNKFVVDDFNHNNKDLSYLASILRLVFDVIDDDMV
ncbi:uncharacterized protein [Glycine max]|uniref:uncharacterized protein n=1 Tax=Glycine max TaxID=3847 RepID=UPI0003DEA4E3|nr:uncharacterized protein LOC102666294 [Glycine max]|eukprot:XP_006596580.1 uncharacterized protein LOC102666294 [Glycine max]